jgi:AraC family transcriptional regulator
MVYAHEHKLSGNEQAKRRSGLPGGPRSVDKLARTLLNHGHEHLFERRNMISASGINGEAVSHGLQMDVRGFSGARGARVIGGGNTRVGEHSHDWPVLSLYVMGDYRKTSQDGETSINGPSVVLHGAGEAHANQLNAVGLEQIDIEFDPEWLRGETTVSHFGGVRCWMGGRVAAMGMQLASLWTDPNSSEQQLAEETAGFLHFALASPEEKRPQWLDRVSRRLQIDSPPTASDLAEPLGLHPTWLAQAYRAAAGEGLRQTLQRRRVEHATMLLRTSDFGLADLAADAGFCDQSHMNRAFRQLLGRTPAQVRAEGKLLGTYSIH